MARGYHDPSLIDPSWTLEPGLATLYTDVSCHPHDNPTLQVRKPRLDEVKYLIRGHTAGK